MDVTFRLIKSKITLRAFWFITLYIVLNQIRTETCMSLHQPMAARLGFWVTSVFFMMFRSGHFVCPIEHSNITLSKPFANRFWHRVQVISPAGKENLLSCATEKCFYYHQDEFGIIPQMRQRAESRSVRAKGGRGSVRSVKDPVNYSDNSQSRPSATS